ENSADDAESGQTELTDALASLTETTDAAAIVVGAESGVLMDASTKDAFIAAIDHARDAEAEASTLAAESLPEPTDKPSWAWELFGETAQLNAHRDDAEEMLENFDSAADTIDEASDAVQETGTASVLSAADAAGEFEAAHVSARNLDILSLRGAAEQVSEAALLDATTADAYVHLEASAAAMLASEQAELAEK